MTGSLSGLAAGLVALGLAGPVLAQEEDAGPLSRFSGSMGVDFTNAYIFRGIVQGDDGFTPALGRAPLQPVLLGDGPDPRRHHRRGRLEQLPQRGDPREQLADLAL
jgi:hypothetical protein